MNKTILVAGYGPGISNAVAERFGKAGFDVALIARSADRLAEGVGALESKRIRARAFTADLSDPGQARDVVGRVRSELGPIDAIAWVAYSSAAGDLLAASPAELDATLRIATTSLLATVQAALPDLRERKGSVLVTNGGYGLFDENIDAAAVRYDAAGLAIANAAKHKLVGLLAKKLAPEVFVGEVMVLGLVKGTAFDKGGATIEPAAVAERFWDLHEKRAATFAQIG